MKKFAFVFTFITIAFTMLFTGCREDELGQFTAEEAKVKLRHVSQEMQKNLDDLMAAEEVVAINNLVNLMGLGEFTLPADALQLLPIMPFNLMDSKEANIFTRENMLLKSQFLSTTPSPDGMGLFVYNFDFNRFDFVEPLDHIVIRFPANQSAFNNRQNNAELRIQNLEIIEIEFTMDGTTYRETFVTNVDANLRINNISVMTLDFSATYSNDGLPLTMAIDLQFAPYRLELTLVGSGLTYTSIMSFTHGDEELMSYNLTANYSTDMESVLEMTGYITLNQIKLDGSIQPANIEDCPENSIECINTNMDLQLIHIGENKIFGQIEFRLYHDTQTNEQYPAPVIIYEDGTWEWLTDIFYVAEGI